MQKIAFFILCLIVPIFVSATCQLPEAILENTSYTCEPSSHAFHYEFTPPYAVFEEQQPFYGLASFYNGSQALQMDAKHHVTYLEFPYQTILKNENWLGFKARFHVFMFTAPGAKVELKNNKVYLSWPPNTAISLKTYLGPPEEEFAAIRYSYLWDWLAQFCRWIEKLLLILNESLTISWGMTIILFSILLKIILLPLQKWMAKAQQQVNDYRAILTPKLREIKKNYDGEEAHRHLMAEYKFLNITPFYALKPLMGMLVQLPILIAVFNVLGEMHAMSGVSFLWIKNLVYPDTLFNLPWTIPLLGNTFNLLPFLMTIITLVSTLFSKNPKQYGLYAMALGFLILFYPFPAAMVLFWTLMNLWQWLLARFL